MTCSTMIGLITSKGWQKCVACLEGVDDGMKRPWGCDPDGEYYSEEVESWMPAIGYYRLAVTTPPTQ